MRKYKDITDKTLIKQLIDPNGNSHYDEFLPKVLQQMGIAKRIKNDNLPDSWSGDTYFQVNHSYPLYLYEGVEFVVNPEGKAHKLDAMACWKIKRYYEKQ